MRIIFLPQLDLKYPLCSVGRVKTAPIVALCMLQRIPFGLQDSIMLLIKQQPLTLVLHPDLFTPTSAFWTLCVLLLKAVITADRESQRFHSAAQITSK